jgi:DNA polymerase-3 subunit alpha
MFNAVSSALRLAERSAYASAAGQTALFGDQDNDEGLEHLLTPVREWSSQERLTAERESLGLYLSGHPFAQYAGHCEELGIAPISNVLGPPPSDGAQYRTRREVKIAGLIEEISRRGNRVSVRLDDDSDRVEVTLFDEAYAQYGHLLTKDVILVVQGQLRYDDFLNAWRVTAKQIRTMDEEIEENACRLTICWNSAEEGAEFIRSLRETLQPFKHGQCAVCVEYAGPSASASLTFGEGWTIRPTRELRDRLTQLLGEERYRIHYPKHPV